MTPRGQGVLTIGALSAATGIPVATIRTWERRYGFPVADRKPSGHRVYPVSIVPRVRLIGQVLARGHRAAEVVPASERELEALLAAQPQPRSAPPRPAVTVGQEPAPTDLFAAVQSFDAEALRRVFQAEWARRGPLEFVEQRAAPFLKAIGDAWAQGELDVRHEHFASASLGDFLRTVRVPLEDRASGPIAALATLPDERHGLGLQMSALIFALAGWDPLVLGVDTPVEQIVALAREAPIDAVALSAVLPVDAGALDAVRTLRRRLPRGIPILLGGSGAADVRVRGVELMPDLRALDEWLRTRA
ncbi:MAG TPA: cobalamin-dependent protein [Longimicrobiales bacterium]